MISVSSCVECFGLKGVFRCLERSRFLALRFSDKVQFDEKHCRKSAITESFLSAGFWLAPFLGSILGSTLYMHIYLSIYLSIHPSIHASISLSSPISKFWFYYLHLPLSTFLCLCLSLSLSLCFCCCFVVSARVPCRPMHLLSRPQSITQKCVHTDLLTARERQHLFV